MGEAKRQEHYEGTVTQVGNSKGMRLPAGLFRAYPEFNGKVRVTVVGEGQVLLSAKGQTRRKAAAGEDDPVMASFLRFMEEQMIRHPEEIVPADAEQLRRIGKLVEGVVSE